MQRVVAILGLLGTSLVLNSCFLVGVPVKATGEIIEKSAHASGRAMKRGFDRATTPDGQDAPDAYTEPAATSPYPQGDPGYPSGNAGYYDEQGNPIR